MKKIYHQAWKLYMLACITTGGQVYSQTLGADTLFFTGTMQTFTVPACVGTLSLDLRGGQGANAQDKLLTNSTGGPGGRAQAVLTVTPGQVLNVFVGGAGNVNGTGGYNGGGAGGNSTAGGSCFGGYAGGGGGATDIRLGGVALSNRIIVAGGGGGSGRDYCNGSCQPCGCGGSGGAGGGLAGLPGASAGNCGYGYPGNSTNGGAAGTATAGGTGGIGDNGGSSGTAGTATVGGTGGGGSYDVAGGGGGGGYYGGGGGGSASSGSGVGGGGGGGGSSYVGGTGLTNGVTTPSFQIGNGMVIFRYYFIGPVINAAAIPPVICLGNSATLTTGNSSLTTHTWSPGGSNASSIVVSPGTATSYTIDGLMSTGCVVQSILTVSVDPAPPALTVTSNSTSICPSQTVVITASGATSYSFTGGISNGVPFAPVATAVYSVTGSNACGTDAANVTITVTPLPVFAVASPTIVCASKPTTLTAGGAPNYTWQPGVNLTGNSVVVAPSVTTVYSVTGSDGTCAGFHTLEVQAKPNPTINVTASNSVICDGEVVTISANGADTYTWNPNLITGNSGTVAPAVPTLYSVLGTNSVGCISAASQVVLVNASPSMSVVASPSSICVGSSATLTAAGNGHSYLWSTSTQSSSIVVSPLVNTTYSVTGSFTTSNMCTRTATVAVNAFHATLSVSPASPTICAGEEIVLSAGHGSNYLWSTAETAQTISVSPTSATIYTVSATTLSNNISCVAQNSVFVDVHPAAQVNATASPTNICRGHTTTLTANGTNSYKWTGPMNSTQSSFTWSTNLATTYTFVVTGTDENGCEATDQVVISVGTCVGLDEQAGSAFNIYPNPNNGVFTVEGSQRTSLQLINELGQVIRAFELQPDNHYKVKVSELSRGIYFLSWKEGSSARTQKIIVE